MIEKLQPPNSFKGIRSILGMQGSIEDSFRIVQGSKTLCSLLKKEMPVNFFDKCLNDFNTLKEKLTSSLVILPPKWEPPFELICDARDYKVGAVLRQCKGKIVYVIYYT